MKLDKLRLIAEQIWEMIKSDTHNYEERKIIVNILKYKVDKYENTNRKDKGN